MQAGGLRSSQRLSLEIPDVVLDMFHGPNTQLNCLTVDDLLSNGQ